MAGALPWAVGAHAHARTRQAVVLIYLWGLSNSLSSAHLTACLSLHRRLRCLTRPLLRTGTCSCGLTKSGSWRNRPSPKCRVTHRYRYRYRYVARAGERVGVCVETQNDHAECIVFSSFPPFLVSSLPRSVLNFLLRSSHTQGPRSGP